jgi:hypothetical protein
MAKHSTKSTFITLGYEFNNAPKMQHFSCDSKDRLQMMRVCYMADMRYELYGENTTLRGSRLCVIPYSLELHYQEGERSHEQRHAKALLSSVSLLTREKSCV